ncbi:hypothetical protein QEN19_000894 [Hanseniaspora menglaensis]
MSLNLDVSAVRSSKNYKRGKQMSLIKTALSVAVLLFLGSKLGFYTILNTSKDNESSISAEFNDFDMSYDENEIGVLLDPSKYITEGDNSLKQDFSISSKNLVGRFLHITDPHPDPYYKENALIETSCHRGLEKNGLEVEDEFPLFEARGARKKNQMKTHKQKIIGSKFGDPMLGCDSPVELVTNTFKYLEKTFKDDIDFIIWTGDNSRHDNDRQMPRTSFEIMGNNMDLSQRLSLHFNDIPIIPSIGNNDIYPHNLMELGPSLITRQLATIYQEMIPEEQRRLYERFGSFFNVVVPGKLVVLSLNSMFFFKNNPVVDSCMSESDPGYQHLLWLGSVLTQFRALGIKCWIISHVPLIKKNLELSCFLKINLWIHEYRDVIIGNLMGHMNLDYFNVIKGDELRSILKQTYSIHQSDINDEEDLFYDMGAAPVNKLAWMIKVKNEYKTLSNNLNLKKVDLLQSKYHVVNVAGSIIPTFNPAFRVWEYNISDSTVKNNLIMDWKLFFEDLEKEIDSEVHLQSKSSTLETESYLLAKKTLKDKTIPKKMPQSLPLGPAYNNQFGSPLAFTQYYLDLDKVNKKFSKLIKKKGSNEDKIVDEIFDYNVEYTSDDLLRLADVEANDFTVKTYLKMMAGLTRKKKVWKKYLNWVFVSTGYENL